MSLIGKYAIIKYDINGMLSTAFRIDVDFGDRVEVSWPAPNASSKDRNTRVYMKASILCTFDKEEDAATIIAMNEQVNVLLREHAEKIGRMRQTINNFAKDFGGKV